MSGLIENIINLFCSVNKSPNKPFVNKLNSNTPDA